MGGVSSQVNIGKWSAESTWGGGRYKAEGTYLNGTDYRVTIEVALEFRTQQQIPLWLEKVVIEDVPAWSEVPWLVEGSVREKWPAKAQRLNAEVTRLRQTWDTSAPTARAAHQAALPKPTTPLAQWRGNKYRTKSPLVPAACATCKHTWQVSGEALNELASYQSRLSGHGPTLSEIAQKNASSADRRQVGAYVEGQREQRRQGVYGAVSCPNCGSAIVLFARM